MLKHTFQLFLPENRLKIQKTEYSKNMTYQIKNIH